MNSKTVYSAMMGSQGARSFNRAVSVLSRDRAADHRSPRVSVVRDKAPDVATLLSHAVSQELLVGEASASGRMSPVEVVLQRQKSLKEIISRSSVPTQLPRQASMSARSSHGSDDIGDDIPSEEWFQQQHGLRGNYNSRRSSVDPLDLLGPGSELGDNDSQSDTDADSSTGGASPMHPAEMRARLRLLEKELQKEKSERMRLQLAHQQQLQQRQQQQDSTTPSSAVIGGRRRSRLGLDDLT